MRCGLDKSFKGDAPCGNALEAFRTNVVAHNARLRYSSFEGNLIIPALLMLLFCTILRRNYPARLNGQGLKSQATFSIFLFSFFIFVFPFSSLSSFFFLSFFFSISRNHARRGITILISPRDFYRFLSHSVPLNERRHLIVGGEDDRRLPLFTELPTFFVSIFFFLSFSRITTAIVFRYICIRSPSIYYSIHRRRRRLVSSFFGRVTKFFQVRYSVRAECPSPKLAKKREIVRSR